MSALELWNLRCTLNYLYIVSISSFLLKNSKQSKWLFYFRSIFVRIYEHFKIEKSMKNSYSEIDKEIRQMGKER